MEYSSLAPPATYSYTAWGSKRRASGSNSCKARNFCASPESLDDVSIITFRGPNQVVDASDTTSPPLSAPATPLHLRGSRKRWAQSSPDPDNRGLSRHKSPLESRSPG